MKARHLLGVLSIAVLAAGVAVVMRQGQFVPYVPIEMVFDRGDPVLVDARELLTPEHCREFASIVGEDARFEGERLLISRSFAQDRELVMNYTQKAEEALRKRRATP